MNLDTWLPRQVEFCKAMGNVKGNRYWEARLPTNFRRPPSGNPNPELASFIREKYVERRYAATDVQEPPNIDNYTQHPYAKDDGSNGAMPDAPAAVPAAAAQASAGFGAAGRPLMQVPSASTFAQIKTSPALQPVQAPAMTMDLLGGFDELASSAAGSQAPAQQTLSQPSAVYDPFDILASGVPSASTTPAPVAAAVQPAAEAAPQGRVSLDWTDFHGPSVSVSHSHTMSAPAHSAHAPGQLHNTITDPFAELTTNIQSVSIHDTTGSSRQQAPSFAGPGATSATATVVPLSTGAAPTAGVPPAFQASSSAKHTSVKSADEVGYDSRVSVG